MGELIGTTGKVCDPNGVVSPKHYNLHKSGVECIEIKRLLPSSLADCFKYVFRCDNKDDEVKDLEKAIWYLEDWKKNPIAVDLTCLKLLVYLLDKVLAGEYRPPVADQHKYWFYTHLKGIVTETDPRGLEWGLSSLHDLARVARKRKVSGSA